MDVKGMLQWLYVKQDCCAIKVLVAHGVILTTEEAEISRIAVQSQPGQTV
jgi:hypothetical protein